MSDFPILRLPSRTYDIEQHYGAVADNYYTDGVSNSTTTFTSATANFTAADVGKTIVILWGGFNDETTTIASVTNSTTVVLSEQTFQSGTGMRFYLSRGGDSTAAIQAAIDALASYGGGEVICPGVGYLHTGLVGKSKVRVRGNNQFATRLHLAANSNKPSFRNDYTSGASAVGCELKDLTLDGNRYKQTLATTTIATTAYTAGNSTITLTDASGFLPYGSVKIGTNRLIYTSISGNVLQGVNGGRENTTDANAAIGATVTQYDKTCGIYFLNQGSTPGNELGDPHHLVENVRVMNHAGSGFVEYSNSETRLKSVYAYLNDEHGFRPSWDTWMTDCTAEQNGRAGFYEYWAPNLVQNCKSFNSGGVTAAEGFGFFLESVSQPFLGEQVHTNCLAEDNTANGWFLLNTDRAELWGCGADSNSKGSVGTYAGFRLKAANLCHITGSSVERKIDGTNSPQQNAMDIDVASTGNTVIMTHGAAGSASVGTFWKSGSDLSGGNNDFKINGIPMDTAGNRYKTADQTISSTSFADITGLTFPVTAGVYRFRAQIIHQTDNTARGNQFAVNGPTLTTLFAKSSKQATAGGTGSTDMFTDAIITAYDTANPASTTEVAATTNLLCTIEGIVQVSATGTFALRAKRSSATGSGTVKAGSNVDLERLDVMSM